MHGVSPFFTRRLHNRFSLCSNVPIDIRVRIQRERITALFSEATGMSRFWKQTGELEPRFFIPLSPIPLPNPGGRQESRPSTQQLPRPSPPKSRPGQRRSRETPLQFFIVNSPPRGAQSFDPNDSRPVPPGPGFQCFRGALPSSARRTASIQCRIYEIHSRISRA